MGTQISKRIFLSLLSLLVLDIVFKLTGEPSDQCLPIAMKVYEQTKDKKYAKEILDQCYLEVQLDYHTKPQDRDKRI